MRGHNEREGNLIQLLSLCGEDCPSLKQWIESKKYLSNEIANELISLMANHILSEVRKASMFSLIADEASDVSQKEQLCINLQWVDNDLDIHEAPVELICVPKTDSSTLYTLIRD